VADPWTGLQNSYLAWHFVDSEALDVFAAMKWLKYYTGWDYHLAADPENPLLQRVSLTKNLGSAPTFVTMLVGDTQWFMFDNGHITVLDEADVNANYDSVVYTLPPNPPPPPASTNVINNPVPQMPAPPITGGAPSVPFPPGAGGS
jgi:hypothetical protein